MLTRNRTFLRRHIEAVWGVQLPQFSQNDIELLPTSLLPPWKLCAAEIGGAQIRIWQAGLGLAERTRLLKRADEAGRWPATAMLPPEISREVALSLDARPTLALAQAQQIARPLVAQDYPLIEAFQPEVEIAEGWQPACQPYIGVIVRDHLLSLAHSSRRTSEACELGIDTLPHARRRGYALAAVVLWSQTVLQESLTPLYSALAENEASLTLAHAAGYRAFAHVVAVRN